MFHRRKKTRRRRRRHTNTRRLLRPETLVDRRVLATFMVTNIDDAGAGSLRQAILVADAAPGLDTIEFDGAASGTIGLTSGQLNVAESLTINGPGSGILTIDAGGNSRIFNIDDGNAATFIDVEISGLTLTGGSVTSGPLGDQDGGAINSAENITVTDAVISNNSVGDDRAGISVIGGGSLTVERTTVSDNTSAGAVAQG